MSSAVAIRNMLEKMEDSLKRDLKDVYRHERREYSKMVVDKEIERVLKIAQEQLRSPKLKNKDDVLPFISTCNHIHPNVFSKVSEIYENLQTSKTLSKIFAKHELINYKKQPYNLNVLQTSQMSELFRFKKSLNLRVSSNHLF